jgi:hypothetical protein
MKLQSVTITWSPAPRKFRAGAAPALALDFFFFLGGGASVVFVAADGAGNGSEKKLAQSKWPKY